MGEVQGTLFPLELNRSLKLRSTPESLTAHAGAVPLREVGERLGLWKLLEKGLSDPRNADLITHPFGEPLRTAVLVAAQGWSRHTVELSYQARTWSRPRRVVLVIEERPRERTEPVDSFAVSEAALLLSMVAASLMHAGRLLAQHPNAQLWSRETFRRLVLKAPGQVARSSRYVTLWIQERWGAPWAQIGRALGHLPPARGSPALPPLPLPA